jgi:shikimate kinase
MNTRKVYILIGPKGSGKTFIGTLFRKCFHVEFVRVEDWILPMKKGRSIDNEGYIREAFQTMEAGIRKALQKTDRLAFESTGLSEHFDTLLENLKHDFRVITIRVMADPQRCLSRIHARDQSVHINVSDRDVEKINAMVISKNAETDFTIHNDDRSEEDLLTDLRNILIITDPEGTLP